jgi:hypothetical protein
MAWFDRSKYRDLKEAREAAIAEREYERSQRTLESLGAIAASRGVEELFGPLLRALRQSFEVTEIKGDDAVFRRADDSEGVTVLFAQSSVSAGLRVRSSLGDPTGSVNVQDRVLRSNEEIDGFTSEILKSRYG